MGTQSLNNISQTVANNLCIGCGVCQTVCKDNAISIVLNKNKEYRPIVDENCTNCGKCNLICPENVKNLNFRIRESATYKTEFGLKNTKGFFIGHETNYDSYIKSSSGGVLSALLKYLLKESKIDAVIHAEQLEGNNSNIFYKASISTTAEEIDDKRSSFYYPIEFSSVIKTLKEDSNIKRVAFLGVPCVLSAIKNAKKYDSVLRKKITFSFALICSHNASGQFTECLANYFNPSSKEPAFFKHRDKVGITNHSVFNNLLVQKDGTEIRKSRNQTPFTNNWRTYAYAFKACSYCPDFWGNDADAGFKDAWGFSVKQKEGETLFHINNRELIGIITEMKEKGLISFSSVDKTQYINSQKDTLLHKANYIEFAQRKHKALRKENKAYKSSYFSLLELIFLSIGSFFKSLITSVSKFLWRNYNKRIPNFLLKLPAFIIRKMNVYLKILSITKELNHPFEVIYTAGYGYKNIGDEAQLSSNLSIWKEKAPDAKITLLSPNPEYTRNLHGNYEVLQASRNSFWGFQGIEYAGIGGKSLFKHFFRFRFFLLKINVALIKIFNRTIGISPESAYLLKKLKAAKVLHIGGGGFLTGKTESRLFDYMGLIYIADKLGTDVILSGHNIGIWQNKYHKRIAKQLKKVKFIGLRDNAGSVKDLHEINIYDKQKVFPLFDDALFCPSIDKETLQKQFFKNGINPDKKYIIVNAHFLKETKTIVEEALNKLTQALKNKTEYLIILLSMHSSDFAALEYLQNKLGSNTFLFKHNDDFKTVISLIQNAEITITLRHHPIIFSMAGAVPTLSIVFDDYFIHKNIGAMTLFKQEDKVKLYKDDFSFEQEIDSLIKNRNKISNVIKEKVAEYKKQNGFIIEKYLKTYAPFMLKDNHKE